MKTIRSFPKNNKVRWLKPSYQFQEITGWHLKSTVYIVEKRKVQEHFSFLFLMDNQKGSPVFVQR